MALRLSSLHLRLHRPMVAALMAFLSDISTVSTVLAWEALACAPVPPTELSLQVGAGPPEGEEGSRSALPGGLAPQMPRQLKSASRARVASQGRAARTAPRRAGPPGTSEDGGGTDAEDVSSVTASSIAGQGPVGPEPERVQAAQQRGASQPASMRLVIEMRRLAVVLPYESPDLRALASARVESFSLTLTTFPDSLTLDAALGNAVAVYEVQGTGQYRVQRSCCVRGTGPQGYRAGGLREEGRDGGHLPKRLHHLRCLLTWAACLLLMPWARVVCACGLCAGTA